VYLYRSIRDVTVSLATIQNVQNMITFFHFINFNKSHKGKNLNLILILIFKIFNAEVLFREDATTDQFIDVIQGNRKYMTCMYVYNKIDQVRSYFQTKNKTLIAHKFVFHSTIHECNQNKSVLKYPRPGEEGVGGVPKFSL
jgi:hypothetical protein